MNLPLTRDRWPARWRELFEERAGMMEFQANLSREVAEMMAERDIRRVAAEEPREERTA